MCNIIFVYKNMHLHLITQYKTLLILNLGAVS